MIEKFIQKDIPFGYMLSSIKMDNLVEKLANYIYYDLSIFIDNKINNQVTKKFNKNTVFNLQSKTYTIISHLLTHKLNNKLSSQIIKDLYTNEVDKLDKV